MTELLCHSDASLREFDALVTGVNVAERAVSLDRTAFFPGGGGQPCDRGALGGVPVLRVGRQGDIGSTASRPRMARRSTERSTGTFGIASCGRTRRSTSSAASCGGTGRPR